MEVFKKVWKGENVCGWMCCKPGRGTGREEAFKGPAHVYFGRK